MSIISEYLFALDQWKLLEQWKVHTLASLSLSPEQEQSILDSIGYRSVYDAHINLYSKTAYHILSCSSMHLKHEIMEYSRLESKMFSIISKTRAKIIEKIRHDVCYVRHFLLNTTGRPKIINSLISSYYLHIIELIVVEELSPMHITSIQPKLYIYLKKAPFVNINIRHILSSTKEVVVVTCARRRLSSRQEALLKNIFSRDVTKITREKM
ncbi:hypothetical protein NEMIN01_0148 [Nematocida minor]|uniref:uncharacterized protein n=1 Tax=Nematocida minor TaxID=1912983 RepID=UPI0022210876|nr:uncharacterized protein NEMIN01_0044 [Nematocida minor]XP_051332050.1 uncharacterized protein NEMIN01_0148 [Nematocida minor]KAI5188780.1 hypothetical protein NEMIN01_0044 [Nematocida minor]KAI5188884.1 hypothetical protein NEMIN01_0148 [Nematocida minor]